MTPMPSRLTPRQIRISKAALSIVLYAVVLVIPAVAFLFTFIWNRESLSGWWWVVPLGLFGALAVIAPMVYTSLIGRLEEELFHDQRRYQRTLIAASSGMTRIKDLGRLCRMIVYTVNRTVLLGNTALFLYEPKEQRYVLKAGRYPSMIPVGQVVPQTDPLTVVLQERRDVLVLEELRAQAESARKIGDGRAQYLTAIEAWMRKMEVKLIVPSFSGEKLLAFLALGGKCSNEPYSMDDMAIFSSLASQAALAIENALFFEELRENEMYMVQSEKLASLGQLASGMAHEIHNPLTIISGEAQLYLERFKGQDAKVDEVLRSIIEECQRAADITRRILRFAKPAVAEQGTVNFKTTVEETLALVGYQVRMDRFECAVDVPENLPTVRGNQNQLQEVLLNLILNACQAMGEKGGKLWLSATTKNGHVVLQVKDNGPGIAPAVQRKVFDPFYTTKSSGTGLGLFVSQRIIKAHGGTIEVESVEGRGTCFTIKLPAC
ncbi:MAG: GAF domain-containing protein [Candidatus Omnitrophica bacterium]|nr:GAF domain-containing protein [Candidatus Omnitrophota bacterium]